MEMDKEGCGWRGLRGRGYHHGRLREALLDAARALISERGPAGFTLAEAAKRVGVTGAAPYRHFTDRQALIAALADQGFVRFNERLGQAWEGGKPDALTALRRQGHAYLAFVREEPGLYRAMFGDAGQLCGPSIDASAVQAFAELVRVASEVLRQFCAPENAARELAVQIWAITHGVADLMLAGHFTGPDQDAGQIAADVLEAATVSLVEGAVRKSLGAPSPLTGGKARAD
jgi:AcrR family transcriptional regulator